MLFLLLLGSALSSGSESEDDEDDEDEDGDAAAPFRLISSFCWADKADMVATETEDESGCCRGREGARKTVGKRGVGLCLWGVETD